MRYESRLSLSGLSSEFVPSHTLLFVWWTYQKYSQVLFPLHLYDASRGTKAHLYYLTRVKAQEIPRTIY